MKTKKLELNKIDLHTPFEILGYWWLPEASDNKTPGILTFLPGDVIELKIIGTFSDKPFDSTSKRIDFIHGELEGGGLITLYKNNRTNGSFGSGYPSETFASLNLFAGAHFSSEQEIQFSEMVIGFSHLFDWVSPHLINVSDEKIENGRLKKITAEFTPLEVRSFEITALSGKLTIENEYSYSAAPIKNFRIENNLFNRLSLASSKELSWFSKINYRLVSFYSLLIGEPIDITKVFFMKNKTRIAWLTINKSKQNTKKLHPMEMIVPFSKIQNNFGSALDSWFLKNEKLEPVYNLFFSSFFRSDQYVQTHFLNMCQSVEVFHRRNYEGVYVERDIFKGVKKKIIEAFPEIENEKLKNKLKSGLGFANEFGLSDRIGELLSELPNEVRESYRLNDVFQKDVKDIRNHLTHYQDVDNYRFYDENPIALFVRVEQMKIVLLYFLLKELGLSYEQIAKPFNSKFRYVRDYV